MGLMMGKRFKTKIWDVQLMQALKLHGCMFPGSSCRTWTMTDGNALCSLISFVFQYNPFNKILQGDISTGMTI